MHPFIAIASVRYRELILERSDDQILLLFDHSRNGSEHILANFSGAEDDDTLKMVFYARTRYPMSGARQGRYIEAMALRLSEDSITLELSPPRTIQLGVMLQKKDFRGFNEWENGAEQIDGFIHSMVAFLKSVILVSHVNHRLPQRSGTDSYRKLLPSRLAELTICGIYGDVSVH